MDAVESYYRPQLVAASQGGRHTVIPSRTAIFTPPIYEPEPSDCSKTQRLESKKTLYPQLYCPFRNVTGTASLDKVSATEKAQNYSQFLRLPVLSGSKMDIRYLECKTLGVPKLLEMDVQAGLRQAKRILFKRTGTSDQLLAGNAILISLL